jgi:hypothetical protein
VSSAPALSLTPSDSSSRPAAGLTVGELRALLAAVVAESGSPLPAPTALLDQAELARELRTSTRTIRTLVKQGLPEVRLADSPRYELEPVLTWLRNSKRRTQL